MTEISEELANILTGATETLNNKKTPLHDRIVWIGGEEYKTPTWMETFGKHVLKAHDKGI